MQWVLEQSIRHFHLRDEETDECHGVGRPVSGRASSSSFQRPLGWAQWHLTDSGCSINVSWVCKWIHDNEHTNTGRGSPSWTQASALSHVTVCCTTSASRPRVSPDIPYVCTRVCNVGPAHTLVPRGVCVRPSPYRPSLTTGRSLRRGSDFVSCTAESPGTWWVPRSICCMNKMNESCHVPPFLFALIVMFAPVF